MKRFLNAIGVALLVIPLLLYAVFLYLQWGNPVSVSGSDPQSLQLNLGGGRAIEGTLPAILFGNFVFGVLMGILAMLLSLAARSRATRETLEKLQADNRRLGMANRALESALPVLRERYDAAIVDLDTAPPAVNEPVLHDEAEMDEATADIDQLALEDAAARREERRRALHGDEPEPVQTADQT